jgi:hypothetical protein
MPPVSESQRRWAFANKGKGGKEGAAAKEFAEADPGGKLPAKVEDGKPMTKAQKRYGKGRK